MTTAAATAPEAGIGSQYELLDEWSGWVDRVVYAGIVAVVLVFVIRRVRRRGRKRRRGERHDAPPS